MSNLKFYDNGSLAAAGNVATGHSSNLLLGNCNVAAQYKSTYVVAPNAGDIMYIENGIYYFPQSIFSNNESVESPPNADKVILIHTPSSLYGTYFDLPSYETSIFISTGDNPYKNSIIYYGFKLAEGPALTSAAGYFEWLTIFEEPNGAIVNGVDNTSSGNNLVMGFDNRVTGKYNTIMTQHANIAGSYNYISQPITNVLRSRVNFNGSANIIVSSTSILTTQGNDNYVHGFNSVYGNYNLVFGSENWSGKTTVYNSLNGIIGERNRNYGNRSLMLGSSGVLSTGTTDSTMGKLASYNTNLGNYSYIIGTDNFNGFRGVRINTLQYTANSVNFTVTLKDKATFQKNVIYVFYYGPWNNIYGLYNSSSTSGGVTTYTFDRVDSSGNATTSTSALDHDFSSDTSPVYWHCVFPYSAPYVWSSGEGVLLPMNSAASSTTLATTPVNNLPQGGQVYGLGNIIIGHNNVNIGSRSILIGNDLGANSSTPGDKIIRIGNGIGVNYTINNAIYSTPYLSTAYYDGDVTGSISSRQVILENRFTDSKYNSALSMTYNGTSYVSLSHSFSCNSVSSTTNKIALNAPLTLSSTYTYGTSLPTTYLQSGRIFFLI